MEQHCISCGMPLREARDYPLGDTLKDYCVHCATAEGNLKTYDEVLEGMTAFVVKTRGLDTGAARKAARTALATMPAWREPKA